MAQRQTARDYLEPGVPNDLRVLGHTPAFLQWESTCEVNADGNEKRNAGLGLRMKVPSKWSKKYHSSLPYALYGDNFNQRKDTVLKTYTSI